LVSGESHASRLYLGLRTDATLKFLLLISVFMFISGVIHCSQAAPDKIVYEIQERCAKRATEFFNRLGYGDASFENHYNPDLNGCFLLVTITKRETGKVVTWAEWQLWDVNENRELDMLGYRPGPQAFVPGTSENACLVGDFTNCRAGERFGAMVRRYMER
jgi:hypothetical protein